MKTAARLVFLTVALLAPGAQAHHGVAAVGFSDPEGPGVGIDTTAALTLPRSLGFAMARTEVVSFERRADRAAFPQQKTTAWFNTAALGFGITPWLSAYVFQPYNAKAADGGVGTNGGAGDTSLMLAFGWKWDEGLRLIPQKESLDELRDWHFLLWSSCSLPFGPTEHRDDHGEPFAPDLQTGFGSPSVAAGLSALKQLSTDSTFLAEANYQYFFPHSYSFTRYRFGAETRVNAAIVYRLYGKRGVRLDGIVELGGLRLQRDQEQSASEAHMVSLSASGGDILYGTVGMRLYIQRVAVGAAIKRALASRLHEESEQQGSEGLERFRLALAISATVQF